VLGLLVECGMMIIARQSGVDFISMISILLVKIIHKGGGKYRVIEDREEGKYVGRIVDASDVDHFEI
jgi:hypothetical protein